MKLMLCLLLLVAAANAGIVRIATFPIRHPIKTTKVVVYVPVHPKKTLKAFWLIVF